MQTQLLNLRIHNTKAEKVCPFSVDAECKRICILGNNGSGKSSLMRQIKIQNSLGQMSIISAHKNLSIRQRAHRGEEQNRLQEHKHYFQSSGRSGTHPDDNNFIQNDFNYNLELLIRKYAEFATEVLDQLKENKEPESLITTLDTVIQAWNQIFVDKEMTFDGKNGQLRVVSRNNSRVYQIENLSDGERSVLYILIKVVMAERDSVIAIDEPETYLNSALIHQLTDSLESIRKDCIFIYFTHSLEFATSRADMPLFWIKSFTWPNQWDIDPITSEEGIPRELITRIVGVKKEKILFVESNQEGDAALYRKLYPDFTVIPVESCSKVIQYTKSFNNEASASLQRFDKECSGLIDRDLRTDEEVQKLATSKVFVIPVAIYENLFLLKEVVGYILGYLGIEKQDEILIQLEQCVREAAGDSKFHERLLIDHVGRQFNEELASFEPASVDDPVFQFEFNKQAYKNSINDFKNKTYDEMLKQYNQKSLKGCAGSLGYTWQRWYELVLNIFNTDKGGDFRQLFFKNGMPNIK